LIATKAIQLDHRTPLDVIVYLVNFHNKWHLGANTTFIQRLRLIPDVDARFGQVCKNRGWTSRSCGKKDDSFHSRTWTWLIGEAKLDKDMFKDMTAYENARALVNFLNKPKQRAWMDAFAEHMNSIALYDDSAVSSNEASQRTISNLHDLAGVLAKFETTIDPEFLMIAFFEGAKFLVPSAQELGATNTSVATSGRVVKTILGGTMSVKDVLAVLETPVDEEAVIIQKVRIGVLDIVS
jgi:hypothetical protein